MLGLYSWHSAPLQDHASLARRRQCRLDRVLPRQLSERHGLPWSSTDELSVAACRYASDAFQTHRLTFPEMSQYLKLSFQLLAETHAQFTEFNFWACTLSSGRSTGCTVVPKTQRLTATALLGQVAWAKARLRLALGEWVPAGRPGPLVRTPHFGDLRSTKMRNDM